jgi:hypothetical protein
MIVPASYASSTVAPAANNIQHIIKEDGGDPIGKSTESQNQLTWCEEGGKLLHPKFSFVAPFSYESAVRRRGRSIHCFVDRPGCLM